MKRAFAFILVLFSFGLVGPISAQVLTTTPNMGLQVPDYGSPNWHVPVNYNWNRIDKLVLMAPPTGNGLVYVTTNNGSRLALPSDILTLIGPASATTDGYLTKEDWNRFNSTSSGGLAPPGTPGLVVATGPGTGSRVANTDDVINLLSGKFNVASGILQLDSNTLIPPQFIPPSSADNFGGLKDGACPLGQAYNSFTAGIGHCIPVGSGGGLAAPPANGLMTYLGNNTTGNAVKNDVLNVLGLTMTGDGTQLLPGIGTFANGDCIAVSLVSGKLNLTDTGGPCAGSPSPAGMNFTYTGAPQSITVQAKLLEYAYVDEFKKSTDPDDTLSFNRCSSLAFRCYLDANHTYLIHFPTIASHTDFEGAGGTVLKDSNADSLHATLSLAFLNDVQFHHVTIDQAGNSYGSAGGGAGIVYLQQNSKVLFDDVHLTNSGTKYLSTKGFIIFNSPATLLNSSADNTILGVHVYIEPGGSRTNKVFVDHFDSDGSQDNAFRIFGDNNNFCNVEIAHSNITNVGDGYVGDTGGSGNGIDVDHCSGGVRFHDNYEYNIRFSFTRAFVSDFAQFYNNYFELNFESGAYAEFGGKRDSWVNNTFVNFSNGINITNIANENPEDWSIIRGNHFINGQDKGFTCEECIAENNTVEDTPFGGRVGNGSTTHNSIVKNTQCRNTGDPTHAQLSVCIAVDPLVNSGVNVISGTEVVGGDANIAPVMAVSGSAKVTGVTLGTTTGITYTGSIGGNGFGNGSTVCFANFALDNTHELDGRCGTVSNWTSTSFTVGIDSTGFTAFNPSSIVNFSYFWVPYTAPNVASNQTTQFMKITGSNVNFPLIGSVAPGSEFYVPDGTCTGGVLSGGGLGAFAFGVAGGIQCLSPGSGGGSGGSSSFSALTGATAANSISNGDNAQVWNWKLTTTNKSGLTISESSASTASGLPILFRVSSLPGSTASPFYFNAQNIFDGIYMDTSGIVRSIPNGNGGIDANALVTGTVPIQRMPQIGTQPFSQVAGCSNGQPYSLLDLPNTASPTPNCYGTSYPFGALDFSDSANSFAYARLALPSGIVSEDVDLYWFTSLPTQTAKFTIATTCLSAGEDVINPAFNPAQTLTSTSSATPNSLTIVTQVGVTLTGCGPGQEEIIQIGRDVTDSATAVVSLRGIRLTAHVTPAN